MGILYGFRLISLYFTLRLQADLTIFQMQTRYVKSADGQGEFRDTAVAVSKVQPSSFPNVDVAMLHVPRESSDADHQREEVGFGRLPWNHERLINGSSSNAEFIEELQHAAKQKDEQGRLPLHWAAVKNSSETVVAELLRAHPEGAYEKDNDGNLPLQLLILDIQKPISNFEIVSKIFKANPDGALSTKPKEVLKACLPYLAQMDDLPEIVFESSHPLHALMTISAALTQFSREQRSTVNAFGMSRLDIRLSNFAEEKANDLEQLACAIVRKVKWFGQEMDDCIQLAAELKLKFFISEPACSMRIEQLWTDSAHSNDLNSLEFNLKSFFLRFIFIIIFKFTHSFWIPNPFARFLWNRASYFIFLILILQLPRQVSPGDPVNNIRLELFLAYWLFDICFSEALEFFCLVKKGRLTILEGIAKYADDFWNIYDLISLSVAVVAAVMRGFVHAGIGNITADISNQLHAWALALLWGRLVNILLIVPFIGPLLIMVLVMIFKDLTKFAFLVVLMELPFVVSLYFLENGDGGNEAFSTFLETSKSFFKIVIGQGPDISSVASSSSALLSVGTVLLSVLMLNLLIAMFSKTFDTIVENSTQEYLLQKAQLTFLWMRAPRMPPPLAFFLVVRDGIMKMVAQHILRNETFAVWCVGKKPGKESVDGKSDRGLWVDPLEAPAPNFSKLHFFRIVFSNRPTEKEEKILEQQVSFLTFPPCSSPLEHSDAASKTRSLSRVEDETAFMNDFYCSDEYKSWKKEVLQDWEQNAEFNSEAQMEKFKSRMLRGTEITLENNGKMDEIKSHINSLSNTVQMQHLEIQQMHACMQLILQRLPAKEAAA